MDKGMNENNTSGASENALTSSASATASGQTLERTLGRNEPCHCGSGKKFKRCHGVSAAPKLGVPKNAQFGAGDASSMGGMGGFDPNQMDPQMMKQVGNALKRLPPSQMQKLQSLMQRAMSGQDVAKEAADFVLLKTAQIWHRLPISEPCEATNCSSHTVSSVSFFDSGKSLPN